jgi:amino acid adenylation domain-containing protein
MGNVVQLKEPGAAPLTGQAGMQSIPKLAHGDKAPLSFAQQQIWLHAQLVPELPLYNEPVTISRRGPLDVPALERALTEIVRRHETWRTVFSVEDGEPVQVIQPIAPVHLPLVDLSSMPEAQRESEASRLAHQDALRPFDLSQGPLLRALLVRFSDTEHRLFLTLHHIIFDGYSIYRVLLPELSSLYAAFSSGRESSLPEPPIQYSDFARWEREWLSRNGHLQDQLAYWRTQLGGNLPVLQLLSDRPRPAVQNFRGAMQPVAFSKDLADKLKLLSRREGATLFMTLLASFATLLYRYSSLEDLVIGTVSSGRKRSELEGLLGYFLNPVVLRNDLTGNPTFRELLRRTRSLALDVLSNDDAPFTHVVNALHPNRSLSFNPLFQVLLTLEPPLPETHGGWSVALTQSEVDTGFIKFDLCLELDDRPSGLVGRFKYSTDLFQADAISRMAGHLTTLLEGIAANPDRRLSEVSILTDGERRQTCVEWNNTAAEFPANLSLHQLMMAQAERRPEAIGLVDESGQLSYQELDFKSNQLAAYLRKLGVAPEQPVGLYLEPSREMIIGILGVLKAGGVCVPLDPSYPANRLMHIMEDTQLRVLLTQRDLRPPLPQRPVEVFRLDSDQFDQESGDPIDSQGGPENLAYLIYTSGSTGKPKGVQITHRNLVHSTHARSLYYGREAGRFLLLSSFSFDSSLVGIFGTLCRGGTLVLTPGPLQANLTRLAHLVEQHRISELLCVPSLYSLLLEQAQPGQLASLRTAIVAGESCPAELVERHHRLLPHAALFNEYGPTEAAVWSTAYKCEPGISGIVPIGRPIPNAQVYVLDSHLNPLPVGVAGELCIAGAGVARGYLNRAEETAERFVANPFTPDPFSADPQSRLYRSGDMVRYLPDGNLEWLGRLDHQVKIRGFRIELEEIEAVIAEFKDVRQAVVMLRGVETGKPELIAYVAPVDATKLDREELQRFLSSKLPEAMLPSKLVVLASLPLAPNGKIDREALPAPSEPAANVRHESPQSVLETQLLAIWESVLDQRGIGVTDNFFDLGGHSLLLAKLLLRIEQKVGRRLSLANVFQAPTIRQLAALLEGQTQPKHHPAIVPIQPLGSKPPLFWVRGGPFFRALANRLGPDQPFLGLHLPTEDASRLPVPYQLEDISAALVARLREVQPEGPYYLAGLCVNAVLAYEMARILEQQGQEVAMLVMVDGQNPAYYENFQQEGRMELLSKKLRFHKRKLKEVGLADLPSYAAGRLANVGLRFSVARWRVYHKLGWKVSEKHLEADLDTIVHPASYLYRPQPYADHVVFIQSTDWPACRYYDFFASWDGLIGGGMEVHKIAGGHQSMFYEANVGVLSDLVQDCLSQARERHREALASSAKARTSQTVGAFADLDGRTESSSSLRPIRRAAFPAQRGALPPLKASVRVARFDDYESIAQLELRYLDNCKTSQDWEHLWVDNPVCRQNPGWPIGWVLENGDKRIVGCIGNVPLSYEFEGRPLLAATSRALVVEERYRSYALSLIRHFFKQEGVDLFIDTSVNAKAVAPHEIFRAQRVPVGEWDQTAFWITNNQRFVESFLSRKGLPFAKSLSYPLSAGLQLKHAVSEGGMRNHRNGIEVVPCTAFDERFDNFWRDLRESRPHMLLATRSREVLDWHFGRALAQNRAWALTVSNGSRITAYAILYRQDNEAHGLKRMKLADYQSLDGNPELLAPILFRALEQCRNQDIHVLELSGLSPQKQRIADQLKPHRRGLCAWRFFYKAKDESLAQRLKDSKVWDPCCFDGDASL